MSLVECIGSVVFFDIGGGFGVFLYFGEVWLDMVVLDKVLCEVKVVYLYY